MPDRLEADASTIEAVGQTFSISTERPMPFPAAQNFSHQIQADKST